MEHQEEASSSEEEIVFPQLQYQYGVQDNQEEETDDSDASYEEVYIDIPSLFPREREQEDRKEEKDSDEGQLDDSESEKPQDLNHEPSSEEKDVLLCLICFDPFTSTGFHQICYLPCGHIYGFTCIKRWFEQCESSGRKKKCPQCNSLWTFKDIRLLYITNLCVADAQLRERVGPAELKCARLEEKAALVTPEKLFRLMWMIMEPHEEESSSEEAFNGHEIVLPWLPDNRVGEIDLLSCQICFDPLTPTGDHQICSLPCGHIYGNSCIMECFEQCESGGKCPQCNGLWTFKDINLLYTNGLDIAHAKSPETLWSTELKLAHMEEICRNMEHHEEESSPKEEFKAKEIEFAQLSNNYGVEAKKGDQEPRESDEEGPYEEVFVDTVSVPLEKVGIESKIEKNKVLIADGQEDDSQQEELKECSNSTQELLEREICPICLDTLIDTGDHQICSLPCGHIYGVRCILKWFEHGSVEKCPQCNKKFTDVTPLYTPHECVADAVFEKRVRSIELRCAHLEKAASATPEELIRQISRIVGHHEEHEEDDDSDEGSYEEVFIDIKSLFPTAPPNSAEEGDVEQEDDSAEDEDDRSQLEESEESADSTQEFNRGEIDVLSCPHPFCSDPLTRTGDHQICCLPCGHISGFSCIKEWLEEYGSPGKCFQCNFFCTLEDIKLLYTTVGYESVCLTNPSLYVAVNAEFQKRVRLVERKCATLEETGFLTPREFICQVYNSPMLSLQLTELLVKSGHPFTTEG